MNRKYTFAVGLWILISGCSTGHPVLCLSSLNGETSSYVYRYDGNQLEGSYPFQRNLAQIDNSTVWLSSVEIQKQIEKGEVWDLNYTFSLKKGHITHGNTKSTRLIMYSIDRQ